MSNIEDQGILSEAEKAMRIKARRHLIDFACYQDPTFERARHSEYLASKYEGVEEYIRTKGESGIGRLMVFMPPQNGKSELVSRKGPAWVLGKNPDCRILQASYGADLAFEESRAIRDIILTDRYKAIFGTLATSYDATVEIAKDSKGQSQWDLAAPNKGGLIAAGIGGGLTGHGGNLINIDDPIKKPEEANSPENIKRLMKWYTSVVYTRQRKGTGIVLTHTRWAMKDVAGQLLIKMVSGIKGADQWVIVFLPAEALEESRYPKTIEEQKKLMEKGVYIPIGGDQLGRKPGEPLWPSQFPKSALEGIKGNVENSEWLSLYQQIPADAEDGFFLEDDFIIEDREKVPSGLQWYRYIDLALGKTARSDYNACLAIAHDKSTGDIWGRDMIRVHELTKFLAEIKSWMLSPEERGTIWGVEDVAFQILVFQQFMEDPDLIGVPIVAVKPVGDKMTRLLPVKTRARQKHYKLVNGPWVRGYISEMVSLGGAGHDDQGDTTSGGYTMAAVPKTTRLSFAVAKSQPEGVGYGNS